MSNSLRRVSIIDKAPTVSFVQTSFNSWDTPNQSSLTFKNRSDDINEILNNTRDFEMFKKFLDQHNALNDLYCYMDIEAYSRLDIKDNEQIESHARMLKKKYLNKKYFFAKKGPIDEETQNIVRSFFLK